MNNDAAGASPVDCQVRPLVAEARWYCVSREGMATLCKDEEDARANAAHCDQAWRAGGPHRAVQLLDAATVRQMVEGAWCAGYYDAGYTHDSAYACKKAEECADAFLGPNLSLSANQSYNTITDMKERK